MQTEQALIGAAISGGFILIFLLWVMFIDGDFSLESGSASAALSFFVGLIGFMVLKGCDLGRL